MTSSELYCQACSNMFSDTASQWQGESWLYSCTGRQAGRSTGRLADRHACMVHMYACRLGHTHRHTEGYACTTHTDRHTLIRVHRHTGIAHTDAHRYR